MDVVGRKDTRQDYLAKLNRFIKSSSEVVKQFTEDIGWTNFVPSTTNMPHNSLTKLCKKTEERPETEGINGYSEEPLLPSPLSSPSRFTVKIDAETQRSLLLPHRRNAAAPDLPLPPLSAGELTANFTREERLTLYEHAVKNAAAVAVPPELLSVEVADSSEGQPKELSGLELKKAMRDFKRRPQAYRTKVSTKNKSQIEVTREVINNMMVLLGVEVPRMNLPGTPNRVSAPPYRQDGDSDPHSLDNRARSAASAHCSVTDSEKKLRDSSIAKCQEHGLKRSEKERHNRSRSSRESVKDEEYGSTCSESSRYSPKGEKKHRTTDKYNIKYKNQGTYDKYLSRHKDRYINRGSSKNTEKRKRKNRDKSESKGYEHREARQDKKRGVLEYEDEGGCYDQSSDISWKRGRGDDKYEYCGSKEKSRGSRHSKSER